MINTAVIKAKENVHDFVRTVRFSSSLRPGFKLKEEKMGGRPYFLIYRVEQHEPLLKYKYEGLLLP